MRPLLSICCVLVAMSLAVPQSLEAKGGKGGGGRGKPTFSGSRMGGGGHKHDGGRPQWTQTRSPQHGGKQDLARSTDWKASKPAKEHQAKELKTKELKNKELKHKDRKSQLARSEELDDDADLPEGDSDDPATEPYNKKQKQLLIEQRNRDKRLAQAQHLREIAERNGNPNLAANADRMEAFAHDHYARRVAHLEKFGVTDPTLNPDGGLLDPLTPDGDPLLPDGDPLLPDSNPVTNLVEALLPFLP